MIINETIRFTVSYRPLDMFSDNNVYNLFMAFEDNDICIITPRVLCDIVMIHIDSYNQNSTAEKAPRYRIRRIYVKGILG